MGFLLWEAKNVIYAATLGPLIGFLDVRSGERATEALLKRGRPGKPPRTRSPHILVAFPSRSLPLAVPGGEEKGSAPRFWGSPLLPHLRADAGAALCARPGTARDPGLPLGICRQSCGELGAAAAFWFRSAQ